MAVTVSMVPWLVPSWSISWICALRMSSLMRGPSLATAGGALLGRRMGSSPRLLKRRRYFEARRARGQAKSHFIARKPANARHFGHAAQIFSGRCARKADVPAVDLISAVIENTRQQMTFPNDVEMTDTASAQEPAVIDVGSDRRRIAVRSRAGSTPGLFWLGGFNSDMRGTKALALDAWAAEHGRGCVRFDYSGHGESAGQFAEGTIGRWLEEAVAVFTQCCRGPQVVIGS
jgi:hypothetical protein